MDQDSNNVGLKSWRWDAKTVYLMVSDSYRRRMIGALAGGGMKTASDLNVASGKKRHTYLRQFGVLCKAGILVQHENPQDARKPLYALSPRAVVCKTGISVTVDFGCCLLRFGNR